MAQDMAKATQKDHVCMWCKESKPETGFPKYGPVCSSCAAVLDGHAENYLPVALRPSPPEAA